MDLLDMGRECVWCAHKQCWVHRQICRRKAFTLGEKKCLMCLQLTLWPMKATPSKGWGKGEVTKPLPAKEESVVIKRPQQLLLPWMHADQEC